MDVTWLDSVESAPRAREHLSNLYSLFVVSMMMFDGRTEDDIVELARTSVSSVSSCRLEAVYLVRDGPLIRRHSTPRDGETETLGGQPLAASVVSGQALDSRALGAQALGGRPAHNGRALDTQVGRLGGLDGDVTVTGRPWARAFALRDFSGSRGYLVFGSAAEPPSNEMFLVKVLVQQTAAALANTSLHRAEHEHTEQLRALNEQHEAVNQQLAASVDDLRRQRKIHEVLTGATAAGAGEAGIARSLHQLTQLPVVVEDQFGNVRAWAGPGEPDELPEPSPRRREQLLGRAVRRGGPVRDRDRLVMVVRPRHDVLGVLALIDPDNTAGRDETTALEQAATLLAVELAHQRNLAEVELRLRRDLLDDLVYGTDIDSALARAAALGHDLHGPHHMAVVQWRDVASKDAVLRAVWHAADRLQMRMLAARHAGDVVLLTADLSRIQEFYEAVSTELGTATGTIGVGGSSATPTDLPRSFREAQRAFSVRSNSHSPDGVTLFHQLGLYRLLGTEDGNGEISRFVREWLGPLLDYDNRHHAELVRTLSEYLELGGSYDDTAKSLLIHRSTLRYRLKRIRAITGRDLGDVDTRLNLHVAARALSVLHGAH
jgi:sugar diacid utilization regulator